MTLEITTRKGNKFTQATASLTGTDQFDTTGKTIAEAKANCEKAIKAYLLAETEPVVRFAKDSTAYVLYHTGFGWSFSINHLGERSSWCIWGEGSRAEALAYMEKSIRYHDGLEVAAS